VEAIDRVLIISIDGLRPDLLLRAKMPEVRTLCANGSFTFWAETTPEAYTLPCHVSMLTGVPAEKHGVTWNEYIEQSYPNVPTLFDIAKQSGLSTAMATGKMKFIVFARPGILDDYYYPQVEPVSDQDVALQAVHILTDKRPNVMFIHLPAVDSVGHEYGWGSPEQVVAIEQADRAVGRVLTTLEELKLMESTLVMLTADHGGAAKGHEMNDARSRFIPWIVAGPMIRKEFDLTLVPDLKIQIEDTFATACAFLGLNPGSECVGKPVLDVLEPSALSQ
jgi:predicted AlkP superfamily pyrophosphatase or phosphodiesterase